MFGMDKKNNPFLLNTPKAIFYAHCPVTVALIMRASSLRRRWCEARRGRPLDLWCHIGHPHHRNVLSSEYQNVNCGLYLLIQCRLKTVFTPSETLSEEQDGGVSFVVCFSQGPPGSRGEPGSPGDRGSPGEGKEGAQVWTSVPSNVASLSFLHILTCTIFLSYLFAGTPRKDWRTWTSGKYFLKNNTVYFTLNNFLL